MDPITYKHKGITKADTKTATKLNNYVIEFLTKYRVTPHSVINTSLSEMLNNRHSENYLKLATSLLKFNGILNIKLGHDKKLTMILTLISGGSRGGHRGHMPPLLFLNLLSHSYNLDSKL